MHADTQEGCYGTTLLCGVAAVRAFSFAAENPRVVASFPRHNQGE